SSSLPAKPVVEPDPWHGSKAGKITLEKSDDGRVIHAVGTVRNTSNHQRFGVKVELDVLDAQGKKVGSATDYAQLIEPGKEWKFKALVTDPNAASAKIAAIKEQE
ncbi:MAG TPA: FxLYD domain-containing protein, partial [Verrucomicrobiae bacterium]|nr:FxLYD domain-containing protein [Verrucomicrobiae bacterium]